MEEIRRGSFASETKIQNGMIRCFDQSSVYLVHVEHVMVEGVNVVRFIGYDFDCQETHQVSLKHIYAVFL